MPTSIPLTFFERSCVGGVAHYDVEGSQTISLHTSAQYDERN